MTLCLMHLFITPLKHIAHHTKLVRGLCGEGWCSEEFVPARGVKQGDPLSPVIDRLFRAFPNEIGTKVGNVMTNAAALVDDLVLFAETRMGLQLLLDNYCLTRLLPI